jgi:hypothetical protein
MLRMSWSIAQVSGPIVGLPLSIIADHEKAATMITGEGLRPQASVTVGKSICTDST